MEIILSKILSEIRHKEDKISSQMIRSSDEAYQMTLFLNEMLCAIKTEVLQVGFLNEDQEVDFFKNVKPQILGKLIYYNKVFRIETTCPVSNGKIHQSYYENVLKNLKLEYKESICNEDFYRYYRAGRTDRDHTYFRLGKINYHDGLKSGVFEIDLSFSTYYDNKIAHIIANELGTKIKVTSGPVLEKPGDLAGLLTNLEEHSVLFIDEIHRLSPVVEEYLYSAMEDYKLDIMIESGPNARSVQISLPRYTLVGATTRAGMLTSPLRDRFGIKFRLDYYSTDMLDTIVKRSAKILNLKIDNNATLEIAKRSRGTPRIANRLLRRTRDFADFENNTNINVEIAKKALAALEVDEFGLDEMDKEIILAIIDKYNGGPVGLNTLAVAVNEDPGTIEEVYEPFLIQQGFIHRTPRGREATALAYKRFGRNKFDNNKSLFE